MIKIINHFSFIVLMITSITAHAQDDTLNKDHRTLVSIPAESLQLMRNDMIVLLSALNEILQSLAIDDLKTAADIAENRMGKSAMGKHRATGMGPGRFMPLEMRTIAWGMHESASEFASTALKGDKKQAYIALNNLTGHCVACHNSYRTR